jgi:F-type H+-transporting ATPase subunit alpha
MTTSIRPEEITGIIKERIANFESRLQMNEIGTVLTIGDGVARVFGLKNVGSISTGKKANILHFDGKKIELVSF